MKSLLQNLIVLFAFLWVLAILGSVMMASYLPKPGDPLAPRIMLYFTQIAAWAAPVGFALAWIGLGLYRSKREVEIAPQAGSDDKSWPPPPSDRT